MNSDSLSPSDPCIPGLRDSLPGAAYKRGDTIGGGNLNVRGVLGRGGFGVVYLVRLGSIDYALKTFRDELMADAQSRARFEREAQAWVDLENYPYLVRAELVIKVEHRLFIALEFIAPDEQGLNTLDGYLRHKPPDLAQSLHWAIQFCYGMEYAYSRGIRCHRDIKPANIMIDKDRRVKITDFGLAGVFGPAKSVTGVVSRVQDGRVGLSCVTKGGAGFGTPTHMPPEQFTDAASCDERSDIYSFGIVLYQMASGGRLPFLAPFPKDDSDVESARFWREMHRLHAKAPVPELGSPLSAMIRRCLEKGPRKRYRGFTELRCDLESAYGRLTGGVVRPPEVPPLTTREWNNKGVFLAVLARYDEARRCFDKALELDPRDARAWILKGRYSHSCDEKTRCFDRVLESDPRNADAWCAKGRGLWLFGRNEEAIDCYDKALEIVPLDVTTACAKGLCLRSLGRNEEAVDCYDRAVKTDPCCSEAWEGKGEALACLGRNEEAVRCFDKVIELAPDHTQVCYGKGLSLWHMGRRAEAVSCFEAALFEDLRMSSPLYSNPGRGIFSKPYDEVNRCFEQVLKSAPQDVVAWFGRGACLHFGREDKDAEAVRCYDAAIKLDPRYAKAWLGKSNSLFFLGRHDLEAARCCSMYRALSGDRSIWCLL